jgi:hypothetical protein
MRSCWEPAAAYDATVLSADDSAALLALESRLAPCEQPLELACGASDRLRA